MAKLTNLLIVLACGLAVTAFSLERPVSNTRLNGKALSTLKQASGSKFQHSHHAAASTFLKSAETSSANSADIVASTKTESKSLISYIWNENTKLMFYLAVWYLGNIYCKSLPLLSCCLIHEMMH